MLFTVIAGIDGIYIHLIRYKLHERQKSRYEHTLHTINVTLYLPLVTLLYCFSPTGIYLWLCMLLFTASFGVELLDVRCERASREDLGGLTTNEYLMHFLMSGLRFGATMPLFANTSAAAWRLENSGLGSRPLWMTVLGACIAIPAIGVAGLHILLHRRGARVLAGH